MESILDILQKSFFTGLVFLFSLESIILLIRSKDNKPRRIMGYILLLWAIAYFIRIFGLYTEHTPDCFYLLRPHVLAIGNFYIAVMLLFPMQVLIPGWLNIKKAILLLLPIIAISGIYYLVINLLGQVPIKILSLSQLHEFAGQFNIWYRFVMLLSNIVYILVILKWLHGYEIKYKKWENDNFSDQDYTDISWMNQYIWMIILISILYIVVLMVGGRVAVLLHTIFIIYSFSYLFYKALFYKSPYPDDFFKTVNNTIKDEKNNDMPLLLPDEKENEINEKSFENRIGSYMELFKAWMAEEKPYLYKDFKLTDVSRILPLNRSYLSRVFNDGFGHNFNEVVREYRIDYSKEIITKNPSLPMSKVAELSGFNSDSTFIRAFKQVTGTTPTQFKQTLTVYIS